MSSAQTARKKKIQTTVANSKISESFKMELSADLITESQKF